MNDFFNWLFDATPDDSAPPPNAPPRISPPPNVPAWSDDDELEAHGSIDLEPIYIIIDYHDARGRGSRRRVTLRKLSKGPHAPILMAICHERRAVRHFRTDRIDCFIDDDGEVIDTTDFFKDVLAIDLSALNEGAGTHGPTVEEREIFDRLRPGLIVLVAAARADGEFHSREFEAIKEWVRKEIEFIRNYDRHFPRPMDAETEAFQRLVARLRPTQDSVLDALIEITGYKWLGRVAPLLNAVEAVVGADGKYTADETAFMNELVLYIRGMEGSY